MVRGLETDGGAHAIADREGTSSRGELDIIPSSKPTLNAWLKLVRVHQYAKNALVFLPLLTAHKFDLASFAGCFLAAVAFSLCASSAYIFNDIVDLAADREHPTKKGRPLAMGAIPLLQALYTIPILLFGAIGLAAFVSLPF